tara:strand:+ start:1241 stop:1453 length:213 start_codon:yes stop_codon:yes gene_type:complete
MRYKTKVMGDLDNLQSKVNQLKIGLARHSVTHEEAVTIIEVIEDRVQFIIDTVELEVSDDSAEFVAGTTH